MTQNTQTPRPVAAPSVAGKIAPPLKSASNSVAKMAVAQQAMVQVNAPFIADLRLMGAMP